MLEDFPNIKTTRVITTDTNGIFSSPLFLKSRLILGEEFFEQRSGLQVAKCLIVHVLSRSSSVTSLYLKKEIESNAAMELSYPQRYWTQPGPCISWKSVWGQCRKHIPVCEGLSFYHHPKINPEIHNNVSQVQTKENKSRSFCCKVNISFFSSSRHFNFDTALAVFVSFLNESVHSFNNIRRDQVPDSRFLTTLKVCCPKTRTFPS